MFDRDRAVAKSRRELLVHGPVAASTPEVISSSAPQLVHQPRRMGSTAASSQDASEDICVICLSAVTERAITSPCSHYTFDFVCLVSWLQQRSTCPLCKAEVAAVQYDWQSPTDFKSYAVQRSHPIKNTESGQGGRNSSLLAPYGLPRRPRSARRAYSPPVEDVALQGRREVYRKRLYSLHVGSNQHSGYRDLSPQELSSSPELISKARAWIRRELRVFSFLHVNSPASSSNVPTTSSNAEFLLSYIISIVRMVDLKASNGHAENLLAEFLGRENSRLFLHELQTWLRSPYTKLDEWDQEVQYERELEQSQQ